MRSRAQASALLCVREERADAAVKHAGNLQQVDRGHVDLASLDAAEVGAVDAGEPRGVLLRNAPAAANLADARADSLQLSGFVHGRIIAPLRASSSQQRCARPAMRRIRIIGRAAEIGPMCLRFEALGFVGAK